MALTGELWHQEKLTEGAGDEGQEDDGVRGGEVGMLHGAGIEDP